MFSGGNLLNTKFVFRFSLQLLPETSLILTRLRWSRDSVLAFGTQVHVFAPGRSRQIFRAKKILSTPSFGGEVKPSVPCRSFTASKRSLNVTWKRHLGKITGHFSPSPSAAGCSRVVTREETPGGESWNV
jgi:hypothetical protein